jgi:hypothetical protein
MSNKYSTNIEDKYLSGAIVNDEEDKQKNKDGSVKIIDDITICTKRGFEQIERVLIKLSKDDDLANLDLTKDPVEEETKALFDDGNTSTIYKRIEKNYLKIIDLKKDKYVFDALINFPYGQFNPYVELFLSMMVIKEYEIPIDFIIGLYKELKSDDFKNKLIQQGKYDSGKRKKNEKYINGLFNHCGSLLVIRMDLNYKDDYIKSEFEKGVKYEGFKKYNDYLRVKSKVIKLDVKNLIYILKNGYKDNLTGYMLKLKYSPQKKFYLKLILFFDGRAYGNEDENTIAKKVGDLWKEEITKGEGTYYNYNAYKESRFIYGIGLKHRKDEKEVMAVIKAAMELIKPDYFVRSMLFDRKQKTFQRGQIPETRKKETKPRKNNEIYYKYILPKKTFKK